MRAVKKFWPKVWSWCKVLRLTSHLDDTQWRKVKQMQSMQVCSFSCKSLCRGTFWEYWFINRMGMLHRMLILVEIGQSEYINKMGKLYRMLILRASQNRQRGSSQTTETTNYTARPPLPQQQSGWSTNLVKQLDCRFGPRIAFLGAPETTNRVARPVSSKTKSNNWILWSAGPY